MMIIVGLLFIYLAIKFEFQPLILIPVGIGILLGNIPFFQVFDLNLQIGIYEPGSILNLLYQGILNGWYVPLLFLGIGAMSDFSSLISNPKLMLLGIAAQLGIFAAFMGAIWAGFSMTEAGAIGLIGGADGQTAVYIASKLANGSNIIGFDVAGTAITSKNLIGPIALTAYFCMALAPVIQPPVIRFLTTKKERMIKMRPPRQVSITEKMLFPIVGLLVTLFIVPTALPLLGMFFLGNLLKESGVTKRLASTASSVLLDIVIILLGITIGALTQADLFLVPSSYKIFGLGVAAFILATAGGVIFGKIMNWFASANNQVNPIIGAAGVSPVASSAQVAQDEGLKEDPTNHLLTHAMAPNIAGLIGSVLTAGVLISFLM
jgi:oxaloacetate decarboxylase beta subunit